MLSVEGRSYGAEPAGEAAHEGAPAWVLLVLVDPSSDADLVERTASWFDSSTLVASSHKVTVKPRDVLATKTEGGVTIWITHPGAEQVRLYFVVGSGQARRFLVRSVPLPHGLGEVGRERLAQVTYSSAVALWQGSVGSETPEMLEQLEAAPAAPPARTLPSAVRRRASQKARVEPSTGCLVCGDG